MVKVKETGLTLASSAYEAIRQDIMEGHIAPGEKLQFDALRERYDVGISPIREALSRLHSDGWVEREEQRGYRVTAISRDELLDAVRTRTLIEGVAIDEAMRHGGTLAEETLVLAYHRLSKERRLTAEGSRHPRCLCCRRRRRGEASSRSALPSDGRHHYRRTILAVVGEQLRPPAASMSDRRCSCRSRS